MTSNMKYSRDSSTAKKQIPFTGEGAFSCKAVATLLEVVGSSILISIKSAQD